MKLPALFCLALAAAFAEEEVVFRSDVALVRVDVQVLDAARRPITGLSAGDFNLRDDGREVPIRNFSREEMPLDVLFLLDVSGSMRPHIERVAEAAQDALRILRQEDRVGILVFDRAVRTRLPFRYAGDGIASEFDRVLQRESFNGGTDITRAFYEAARFVQKYGRKEVRRAIIIVTDDRTEFNRDDAGVLRALTDANVSLSALLTPDAMPYGIPFPTSGPFPRRFPQRPFPQRPFPQQGGGWPWPGGGGGYPWPGGGGRRGPVILGPGRGGGGNPQHSAGTAEIARQSGGDSLPADDAFSLENTLARLRQQYALHFLAPEDARPGQERTIAVALTGSAGRRYSNAELRFRRVYIAPASSGTPVAPASKTDPVPSAPQPEPVDNTSSVTDPAPASTDSTPAPRRRRPGVSEPTGPRGPQ